MFLDKLLHFSEPLFSCLKVGLKTKTVFQDCYEDEKYSMLSSLYVVNAQ